ncbi:MAG TPA: FecR domain-containing protein, partial [Methyloradius sp.]
NETQRLVTLYKGEILIETGHESLEHYRPFIVKTVQGKITALGTRFTTRQHDGYTTVNLYEGKLAIKPEGSNLPESLLEAGETISFNDSSILQKSNVLFGSDAWSTGFLVVDKMTLEDFLVELSRYRTGTLRCDPQIAHVLISGAYPIHDADAILRSITERWPIRIESFTSYWITLKPA